MPCGDVIILHLCVDTLQGGDRRDSAQRGPQSGHRPPPRLNNTLQKWQEPHRVQVYLQGGAHKGNLLTQHDADVSSLEEVMNVYGYFRSLCSLILQRSVC